MRATLPNALSLSRIVLAVAVLILSGQLTVVTYIATVCIVVLAIVTDVLDGCLARRWHVESELGYVLDGLGDRAIHVAFLLVFLAQYGIHPVLVWLLVFKDIAVYAIRAISKDWLQVVTSSRRVTLSHVACLRIWIGLYLVRDGFHVTTGTDRLGAPAFEAAQLTLLWATIILSYYGLFRSFSNLIGRDNSNGTPS